MDFKGRDHRSRQLKFRVKRIHKNLKSLRESWSLASIPEDEALNASRPQVDLNFKGRDHQSRQSGCRVKRNHKNFKSLRESWSLPSIPEDEALNSFCPQVDLDEEDIWHRSPVTEENGYKPKVINRNLFSTDSSTFHPETFSPKDLSRIVKLYRLLSWMAQNIVVFLACFYCTGCWIISILLFSNFFKK